MISTDFGRLFSAANSMRSLGAMCKEQHDLGRGPGVPESNYNEIRAHVDSLIQITTELGLASSQAIGQQVKSCMNETVPLPIEHVMGEKVIRLTPMAAGRISHQTQQLIYRLPEELSHRKIFAVSPSQEKYFDFVATAKVTAAFGVEASNELSEAGSSLAFDRNTAGVFHLMRAMEIAVRALGDKLSVPIFRSNATNLTWGQIVENMKDAVEAMPSGPEKLKWSENLTLLTYVSRSWRNQTMHPDRCYTAAQAEDVFNAVKAFMTDLAELI